MLEADGTPVAELPLIGVDDIEQNEKFDGAIDPAEELDLRVDFQGPGAPSEFLEDDTALIRLTISGEDDADVAITSYELYVLPSVVT